MSTMIQYVLYLAILVVLAIPLGAYIKNVMSGEKTFFVQSSDTVRKPDLQGYACRQRRTDDMEKYAVSVMIFPVSGLFFCSCFNFCREFFPETRRIFPV